MSTQLGRIIDSLVEEFGQDAVWQEVQTRRTGTKATSLTVIVNAGMHPIPKRHLRGQVFNFSEGTLALDPDHVEATIADLCRRAAGVVAAAKWKTIYLVPTGHPLLSVAAALLIFRITRLDPVIVSYFAERGYRDVRLDLRRFIVGDGDAAAAR